MEALFVLPNFVETGQDIKGASVSCGERLSSAKGVPAIDFDQLLEKSVKMSQSSFWGNMGYPLKSCSSVSTFGYSNGNTAENVDPCSFSSAPLVFGCPSSDCSSGSTSFDNVSSGMDFSPVRESIFQFLENLESINLSLDLGEEGTLQIVGAKNESGELSFQIQGSKDALADFFTMIFGYLSTVIQSVEDAGTCFSNCGVNNLSTRSNNVTSTFCSSFPYGSLGEVVISEVGEGTEEGVDIGPEYSIEEEENIVEENPLESLEEMEPRVLEEMEPRVLEENETGEFLEALDQEMGSDSLRAPSEYVQENQDSGKAIPKPLERKSDVNILEVAETSAPTAPRTEGTSLRTETVSVSSRDATSVEKIFDRILQVVSQKNEPKEVVIKLQPESLGSIVVRLREEQNHLQCVWEIADPQARELIQRSLPLLEARLQGQGFTFENFWDGNSQRNFGWNNSSIWAENPFSDTLRESEEGMIFRLSDYRVNLLA
ncbi:MAG: flagellar hook-length control protein FliK [Candidatus Caldatribacteriaceae bacterium]